jgi:hypothetical protein
MGPAVFTCDVPSACWPGVYQVSMKRKDGRSQRLR